MRTVKGSFSALVRKAVWVPLAALVLFPVVATSVTAAELPLVEPNPAPETLKVTLGIKGDRIPNENVFKGFGCNGGNTSVAVSWSGAPKETKSFALIVHDPDAPTGVGFFHWSVFDIPANVTSLEEGASPGKLPKGAMEGYTDFGGHGYGGPCPPPGPAHRYIFTVYALKVPSLGMKANATGALLRFVLNGNSLALGRAVATYSR